MSLIMRRNLFLPICLILVFFVIDIQAGAIARRDTSGQPDGAIIIITRVGTTLGRFPIFGPMIRNMLKALTYGIDTFESRTDGFLGKLVRDALPCTLSISDGFVCAGIERNGGPDKILINAIRDVPSSTLPDLAKWLIELGINHMLIQGSSFN